MFQQSSQSLNPKLKKGIKYFAYTVLILLSMSALVLSLLYFLPLKNPAVAFETEKLSYEASLSLIQQRQSQDDTSIDTQCSTKAYNHGKQTEKAILLYHGFTNCPAQYSILADQLFQMGYNVYVPRLPYHGYADKMTTDLEKTTAGGLAEFSKQTVSEVSGLGQKISVYGISGGGNIAMYSFYNSNLISKAVISSPFLVPNGYPSSSQKFVSNTLNVLPSMFIWWDDEVKDQRTTGPLYAYPRFSTKALAAFVGLGDNIKSDLEKADYGSSKFKNRSIFFYTVEADPAINNETVKRYSDQFSKLSGLQVNRQEFTAATGLGHDVIDPNQAYADTDFVYPMIISRL